MTSAPSDDDLATAAKEGSLSAGEGGDAADGHEAGTRDADVIIGEIPDARDTTILRWTARCTDPDHDLLGSFDSEEAAREAKAAHLSASHSTG